MESNFVVNQHKITQANKKDRRTLIYERNGIKKMNVDFYLDSFAPFKNAQKNSSLSLLRMLE